jgi:UDP-N-acetylglucosamine 2-epimerase
MEKTKKEILLDKIEEINQIIELPQLYLANFYSDLRNDVDKEIVFKQYYLKDEDENKQKLTVAWQEIISEIDSFERQSIQKKYDLNKNQERINKLKEILIDNHTEQNLDEIEKGIQNEKMNLLQNLFQNKSILFSINETKYYREFIDFKLVIINDEFISYEAYKEKYF